MKEKEDNSPSLSRERERERAGNGMSDARNEIGPIKIRRRSRRKKRHAFFSSPFRFAPVGLSLSPFFFLESGVLHHIVKSFEAATASSDL